MLKRAALVQNTMSPARYNWQGSASYVTGSHNLKFGGQYQFQQVRLEPNALHQRSSGPAAATRWTSCAV